MYNIILLIALYNYFGYVICNDFFNAYFIMFNKLVILSSELILVYNHFMTYKVLKQYSINDIKL